MREAEQRHAILAVARTWLRTPYHHHAAVKGAGVDCAQLLAEVYREAGLIPLIEIEHYPPDWHLHRDTERYLGWVERFAHPVDQPLPGDVVLVKVGRCFAHGAIVTNWPEVIHAVTGEGCILGDLLADGRFSGRERRFFSLFGGD